MDVDGDPRVPRVIHVPYKPLRDGEHAADGPLFLGDHLPFHVRRVLRDPAIDFPVEIFHDFRAPLLPPSLGRGDLLPTV